MFILLLKYSLLNTIVSQRHFNVVVRRDFKVVSTPFAHWERFFVGMNRVLC